MKNIKVLAALMLGFSVVVRAEDLVVTVDSLVRIVNEKSGCSFENWAKKIENTCLCCLVKNAQSVFSGKKATEVVHACLKDSKCSDESIKTLMGGPKKHGMENEEFYQGLIRHVYDTTVVVKQVRESESALDEHGYFKEKSVQDFLVQAFKENKLLHAAFRKADCLKIKDMVAEKSEAPWGTLQLFLIESSCNPKEKQTFIFKEMKSPMGPEGEVFRLVKGAKFQPLEPLIYPKKQKNFPQFIFPIAYVSYKYKDKEHQLSLMPAASGVPLMSLMKEFAKDSTNKRVMRDISQAYFDTGVAMANYYKEYKKVSSPKELPISIAHGDLHAGNVFYDKKNRQVILIDNERMSQHIDTPVSVCGDVAFLLLKSLFVMKWTVKSIKNFPYKEWFELTVPCFMAGFLRTYSKSFSHDILHLLEACLMEYKDEENKLNWYTDKTILGFKPEEYLASIFDRLNQWESDQKIFMASDMDVNARDGSGKTLLFKAAERERLAMWPLIAAGADVDARDADTNTALHDAAYLNKSNAIKVLVDAGADINAQDRNGDTPLHKAVYNNSKDAIDMLIKLGADKKITNHDGVPAYERPLK